MGDFLDRTLDVEAKSNPPRPAAIAEPHLVVLLECDRPLSLSSRHRLGGGGTVALGRGSTRAWTRAGDYRATTLDLRVPDARMSQEHARLEGALGRWILRDRGSRNGSRVNGEPVSDHPLRHGDLVELGHTVLLYEEAPHGAAPDDVDAGALAARAPGLLTLVPALEETFDHLARIAPTAVPVLVLGETGTGKELAAHAVHLLSGRAGKFVGVNAGAIPESLLESELFGTARGAFSGAVTDRPGLVRAADRGTLFLDEIGDLPLASQAAFLRVLQERKIRPVGSTDAIAVDLRVVCATNHDVERLVREGKFRDDLFARISGFKLTLPPLRERRADLGLLVGALLERLAGDRASTVRFTVEAARSLFSYDFPLNVRELENWLASALALAAGEPIRPEHFPDPVRVSGDDDGEDSAPASEPSLTHPLSPEQERHRAEVAALLAEHKGNVSAVARASGKARTQVHRWLRRYGLDPAQFR